MMTLLNIPALVNEFFTNKQRKPSYVVHLLNEDNLTEYSHNYRLADKEVQALKDLRKQYGEDYVLHLEEVFSDEDDIIELTGGDMLIDIDLDKPVYEYAMTINEIADGTLKSRTILIELSDNEYKKLMCYIFKDCQMNYNMLRYCDHDLYKKIEEQVESYFIDEGGYYSCMYPYTVTMNEPTEDATTLRREHPEMYGALLKAPHSYLV